MICVLFMGFHVIHACTPAASITDSDDMVLPVTLGVEVGSESCTSIFTSKGAENL